ncbi:PorV/PorQ family protein [bacterium]|nr:PorV/PorQ family protein [bacterium]
MEINKKLLLIFVGCLTPSILFGAEKVGQTAFQSQKISKGVRGMAMGDAFVALTNDVTSVYWNPAGLMHISKDANQIAVSRINMPADISYHTLAYGRNAGFGAIGVNVDFLTTDKIVERTVDAPGGTGRTFSASEMTVGLSFAQSLIDNFSYGFTVKYLRNDFHDYKQQSFSFDLGLQYKTDFRGLILGIAVRNFGPDAKFDGTYTNYRPAQQGGSTKDEKFGTAAQPNDFKFALASSAKDLLGISLGEKDDILMSIQLESPSDRKERLTFGTEYNFQQMIFLRGGYKFNAGEENFALGFGLNYNLGGMTYTFDYAYLNFGSFDFASSGAGTADDSNLFTQPHRFSLMVGF